MKRNVSFTESFIRIWLSIVLIGLSFISNASSLLLWIGVVLIITGVLRWCPLYLPFKMKTR